MKKLNYFINFYNLLLSIVIAEKINKIIITNTNTNLYYLLHKGQDGNLSFISI